MMNERQARFVDAYFLNPNATQAAIEAGYSPRTAKSIGARLLTFVDVQEAIRERNAQVESARIMQVDEALQLLTSIARGELVSERTQVTPEGITRYPVKPSIEERRRATETRLKTLGAFVDRHEVKDTTPPVDDDAKNRLAMSKMTDEELELINTVLHLIDEAANRP